MKKPTPLKRYFLPLATVILVLSFTSALHAQALTVQTSSLPNGRVGQSYTAPALSATGGSLPYAWSIVSGALPTGLTLAANGVITGTPSVSGIFNFTVRVTDSTNAT